jgi:hypothetical protein
VRIPVSALLTEAQIETAVEALFEVVGRLTSRPPPAPGA